MSLKELYAKYLRFRREHALGTQIRNGIHRVGSAIHPYARVLIPNFRAAHYVYIFTMVFLGSFIIFPYRNISYVDTLFFSGGAATQAGLNTVDTNTLKLYQQIAIYVFTWMTTPIFIHGSLLFLRLYWFERHFDNIKERSVLDFKMRRSATLAAARSKSIDSTYLNTANNRGLGFSNNPEQGIPLENIDKGEDGININVDSPQSSLSVRHDEPKVVHMSEPSDSEVDARAELSPANEAAHTSDNIRFGNLPQPPKKRGVREKEIDPEDMYRSIAMLRDNHKNPNSTIQFSNDVHDKYTRTNNDDDDVLIIKSPNEIENDDKQPIFTRRNRRRSSNNLISPKKWKAVGSKRVGNPWKRKLRRTMSGNKSISRNNTGDSFEQAVFDDDDVSIDSETNQNTMDDEDYGDDEGDEDDFDGDDDEDEDEDEAGEHRVKKSRSHLSPHDLPIGKRSNTADNPNPRSTVFHTPTIDRTRTKPRSIKSKVNRKLKKIASSSGLNSRSYGETSDTRVDDDDEEDDLDYDGPDLSKCMSTNYLSWVPTVGRNSTFVHLSEEQKEELGGVEYRAVKLLIKILLCYYIGFHILAMVLLLAWVLHKPQYMAILRDQGVSPTWWAFFSAASSFNDLGLTVTADSMISFNRSTYVMIVVAFFVVIGNTGFPVFLRFIIWILFKFAKPLSLYKESLGFLLDHPRRCFTLLFPSVPTWWLFFILVVLNAVDLVLFIVLDLKNEALLSTPVGYRVLQGLFQAFSTRTAGFSVVDLSELHPAVQVSYMIMMYISVLPLAISIRRTNVYEEQSLGIYLKDESNSDEDLDKKPKTFVGTHLRNQLSFDLWFIFLGLFIICICETGKLDKNNYRFSVFSVMFEIISAYGTVGLSLGYPGVDASLSSQFSTISKLVIIAMMIRGRHRGLPYSLDRAIMLPDDHMQRRDRVQENHAIRNNATMERAMTIGRNSTFEHNADDNILTRVKSAFESGGNFIRRGSAFNWSSASGNANFLRRNSDNNLGNHLDIRHSRRDSQRGADFSSHRGSDHIGPQEPSEAPQTEMYSPR
ncbi:potassium transport protein TRK1/TRK2 [Suhomyces tanzawaensis NRRL Y-17324]|uniref:Potassium transport protein n=1 Tax=Suhomyces tanzawaensis NRRL Y-17324 TaxID=984487 RepID=A0A1E4SNY4_9ASCO|nr:potassium transport protein TRK1/TRK2 [Suhomyces tanzawaensis NRRL Y-17324]ODV81240.1 potassium transport protein TRK1/TRK2 [Suhomyces tanzawaensis NRRL Y-17324]